MHTKYVYLMIFLNSDSIITLELYFWVWRRMSLFTFIYFLSTYTQKPEQENEKLGVTHSTSRTVEPRGPALTIATSITAQCHAKLWQIFGETCPIPPGCVQFYMYKTFCRCCCWMYNVVVEMQYVSWITLVSTPKICTFWYISFATQQSLAFYELFNCLFSFDKLPNSKRCVLRW